jgi:hypothetical protein
MEDVPPGRYVLRVDVSDIPFGGNKFFYERMRSFLRRKMASLRAPVTVPDAQDDFSSLGGADTIPPLDLGTFVLSTNTTAPQ